MEIKFNFNIEHVTPFSNPFDLKGRPNLQLVEFYDWDSRLVGIDEDTDTDTGANFIFETGETIDDFICRI